MPKRTRKWVMDRERNPYWKINRFDPGVESWPLVSELLDAETESEQTRLFKTMVADSESDSYSGPKVDPKADPNLHLELACLFWRQEWGQWLLECSDGWEFIDAPHKAEQENHHTWKSLMWPE